LIVTESTGRKLWPGQDPVGKTLRMGSDTELQVIGVAKDAQVSEMGNSEKAYLYLPAARREQKMMKLMVHSTSMYASTANGIREAVQALDPELPVEVAALEDNLEIWRTPSRIVAALSVVLGTLALLLASIGVYGVVSYAVSRRMHEIGIRMAVGADGRDVMGLLLRQAMKPVAIGAVIGIAGCAVVSQVLSNMLFGLSAHDPIAFVGVPVLLMCVALLASYLPARRATRVDPVVALRYE
jgi:putative ABC transport system permease protein